MLPVVLGRSFCGHTLPGWGHQLRQQEAVSGCLFALSKYSRQKVSTVTPECFPPQKVENSPVFDLF